MAAATNPSLPGLVDLRQLGAGELDVLLEEETGNWQALLDWDFQPSADLLRRFLRTQLLSGYALVLRGRTIGYGYFVREERKAVIGDLYVAEEHCSPKLETRLLGAILDHLWEGGEIRRVESQLIMLGPQTAAAPPWEARARLYPRLFMSRELSRVRELPPRWPSPAAFIENWTDRQQEQAARLIARAYAGHVDGEINDQYRSTPGARRFLLNIVQYPGCGTFFQPASHLAFPTGTGEICGLSLASLIAFDIGHITQVCVDPAMQRTGLGYELVRRSLLSLADAGCRRASLTVTESNRTAVELYRRMGFATQRRFQALVWDVAHGPGDTRPPPDGGAESRASHPLQ